MNKFDDILDPPITEFFGDFRFLSNFWPSPIRWQSVTWPTVEHAYQAAKTLDPAIREQIRLLPTPGATKRAGKHVACRTDWLAVRVLIMTELVTAKFQQNPQLAASLIATGHRVLEEGNSWGDTFWGISPAGSGKGHNTLGQILMTVRSLLMDASPVYYAGIGSRSTPNDVMAQMQAFGEHAANRGWILRSGAAVGADTAFETGCDRAGGRKEIYIPRQGYKGHPSPHYNSHPDAIKLASSIHPMWSRLSPSAKGLVTRNMHQILGPTLNTPVRFVLCWTPDGCESIDQYSIRTGGTGTAISLADVNSIPVFNLKHLGRLDQAYEMIERGMGSGQGYQ